MTIICAAFMLVTFMLADVKFITWALHRLQLSSYQFDGYRRSVERTPLWMLKVAAVAAFSLLVIIIFRGWAEYLLVGVVFLLTVLSEGKQTFKKPLVHTPRINRLFATSWCIVLLPIAFLALLCPKAGWAICLLAVLMYAITPLVVMLAVVFNAPREKRINNDFILEAKYILKQSKSLEVVGITGSYGKTSLKFFLSSILAQEINELHTPESYNTPLGIVRTVRESLKPYHDVFVCEMGARHVGDIKEICDIVSPDIAVITSVGEQHLETFGSLENVKNTKFELADAVMNKHGDAERIFVNGDSVKDAKLQHTGCVTYGFAQGNDYRVRIASVSENGMSFEITDPQGDRQLYSTELIGEHNALNITGAIVVARSFGIREAAVKLAVRRLTGAPHRLQLKKEPFGTVIDDSYNSNPEGCKAALRTLSRFFGYKILITPGMVELGERQYELNREFGRRAAAVCDYVVLVGKANTASIREGLASAGYDERRIFDAASFSEGYSRCLAMNTGAEKRVILIENDLPDNY